MIIFQEVACIYSTNLSTNEIAIYHYPTKIGPNEKKQFQL